MADKIISLADFDAAPNYQPDSAGVVESTPKSLTDKVVSPDEFTKTPIERLTPEQLRTITRQGLAPDKSPILDIQNVDDVHRWKAQLLFDTPSERINYLKDELKDHEFTTSPYNKNDVLVRKKGTRYWGKIDPKWNSDTVIKELTENIDSIAQALMVPAGVLTAGLSAVGIEGVRQAAKMYVDPEASGSVLDVGIAGTAGAVTHLPAGLIKAGQSTVKAGIKEGVKRTGSKVDQEALKGFIQRGAGAVKDLFESPQYVAQNLGATARNFAQGIEDKLQYLFENSPEARQAIMKPFTLKGKQEAVDGLLRQTGEKLDAFYGDPNNIVKVADILDSPAARQLGETVQSARITLPKGKTLVTSEKVRSKAYNIQRDMLTRLARVALDEDDPYLKAFLGKRLRRLPEVRSLGYKTENEAMLDLLSRADLDITAAEARAVRDGFANQIKWGKRKGQITDVNTLYKNALDSFSDGIQKTVEETGDAALAANNKLYHNLVDVADVLNKSVNADKASSLNFTKYIPSALNGIKRRSLMIATKLMDRPEFRAAAAQAMNLPEMTVEGLVQKPTGSSILGRTLKGMAQGGSFLELKSLGRKQFLPRDTQQYFNDPGAFQELTASIPDQEMVDTLTKQYERGDAEGFSNTLSMVAGQDESLFDNAPYKSLVVNNGKPVIMDKYEREAYRQHLRKTVTDPRELFRAMQAINSNNEMVSAPFSPPEKAKEIRRKPAVKVGPVDVKTPITEVAKSLKSTDTVVFKDGTKRSDYDY